MMKAMPKPANYDTDKDGIVRCIEMLVANHTVDKGR